MLLRKKKKSTKGQTLSSSIQRRHGKSCKMKTLCYFFKNSGIDSVLCHIFFFSSAIGSLSISLYVSLFVTRCDFMFVSETQFAHYLAHSKKEKFTKGKKKQKKNRGCGFSLRKARVPHTNCFISRFPRVCFCVNGTAGRKRKKETTTENQVHASTD